MNSMFSEAFDDERVDPPLVPIFGDKFRPRLAAGYRVRITGTGELDLGLRLRDLIVFMKERLDV